MAARDPRTSIACITIPLHLQVMVTLPLHEIGVGLVYLRLSTTIEFNFYFQLIWISFYVRSMIYHTTTLHSNILVPVVCWFSISPQYHVVHIVLVLGVDSYHTFMFFFFSPYFYWSSLLILTTVSWLCALCFGPCSFSTHFHVLVHFILVLVVDSRYSSTLFWS